ncbi:MAG: hypothetical protein HRT35_25475 [Algicola sp.]|nr:hypothetical protein [Algicola sp.]
MHKITFIAANDKVVSRMHFNHDVIAEQGIAPIGDDKFVLATFDQHELLDSLIEQGEAQGALMLWQLANVTDSRSVTDDGFDLLLKLLRLDDVFYYYPNLYCSTDCDCSIGSFV